MGALVLYTTVAPYGGKGYFFDGNRPSQRMTTATSVVWELRNGDLSGERIAYTTPYPVSSPDIAPIANEILHNLVGVKRAVIKW